MIDIGRRRLRSITTDRFLSFEPGTPSIWLTTLIVLIRSNAAGN
jgi:hypothetical protein